MEGVQFVLYPVSASLFSRGEDEVEKLSRFENVVVNLILDFRQALGYAGQNSGKLTGIAVQAGDKIL